MRIVFKCEDPECTYPDEVECDPVDDNMICSCGKIKWGHWKNKEDLSKNENK